MYKLYVQYSTCMVSMPVVSLGATNRPQEIDEAARRRLVKRLYIPLPDMSARKQIILNLLKEQKHSLDTSDLDKLCTETDGRYSTTEPHFPDEYVVERGRVQYICIRVHMYVQWNLSITNLRIAETPIIGTPFCVPV